MARLVKAACPQCGAGVRLDPALDWVTCSYCGTSSFIQKPPKKATQAQHRVPAQTGPRPYPVIQLPKSSNLPVVIWIVFAIVMSGGFGIFQAFSSALGGTGVGSAIGSALKGSPIVIGSPMLGDATGDGVLDVLVRTSGGSEQPLTAFDANNGSLLWSTEPLASSNQKLAVIGDSAFVGSLTELSAYDLRSGKKRWQKNLPERLESFCDEAGTPRVYLKDKQVYEIAPSTGELKLLGPSRQSVGSRPFTHLDPKRIPASLRARIQEYEAKLKTTVVCYPASSGDTYVYGVGVDEVRHGQVDLKVKGMSIGKVLRERDAGPYVLLGHKEPGTRVPMAGVHDGQRLLWKAELPDTNPLEAKEGEPSAAVLARGRAAFAYELETKKQLVVVAFEIGSGKRMWTATLPADNASWISLAQTDRHVFVRIGWQLHALALVSGQSLWVVGRK